MTDLITEARGVKSVTEQAAVADIRNAVAAGETGVCGICGRRHPMSELKLLPCPFCGGEARLRYLKPLGWVQCKKCGATSAAVSDYYEETDGKGQAVAAWNRRAQPENARQRALQTGVCPMCEDCPDGCPVETPKDSRNIVTNADRIRSMGDEELAKDIASWPIAEKIPFCKNKPECNRILEETEDCIPESMCVECVLDWLRQPAETEGTT